jgi:hypothetical protein
VKIIHCITGAMVAGFLSKPLQGKNYLFKEEDHGT